MKPVRLTYDEIELKELLSKKALERLRAIDLIILETVDSTQLYAQQLKNVSEGLIVISKIQTAGKGREGRSWASQTGGLWMTVMLLPPFGEVVGRITKIATESIAKSLAEFGIPNCTIKPPNDVYCNGRKIAGVLADVVIQGDRSIVCLGIGVNVNNDPSKIPSISGIATSYFQEIGATMNLLEFAASLIEHFDRSYNSAILELD